MCVWVCVGGTKRRWLGGEAEKKRPRETPNRDETKSIYIVSTDWFTDQHETFKQMLRYSAAWHISLKYVQFFSLNTQQDKFCDYLCNIIQLAGAVFVRSSEVVCTFFKFNEVQECVHVKWQKNLMHIDNV